MSIHLFSFSRKAPLWATSHQLFSLFHRHFASFFPHSVRRAKMSWKSFFFAAMTLRDASFLFGQKAAAAAPPQLLLAWVIEPSSEYAFEPFALLSLIDPRSDLQALGQIAFLEDPFLWSSLSNRPLDLWESVCKTALRAPFLGNADFPPSAAEFSGILRSFASRSADSSPIMHRLGIQAASPSKGLEAASLISSFASLRLGLRAPAKVLSGEFPFLFNPLWRSEESFDRSGSDQAARAGALLAAAESSAISGALAPEGSAPSSSKPRARGPL